MARDVGLSLEPVQGQLQALAARKVILNATHKIGLFKHTFNPAPTSVYADFDAQKCDFNGYVAPTVVITADPGVDSAGVPQLPLNRASYTDGDGTSPNVVAGYYLWDDAADPKVVVEYALFNQTIIMGVAGQQIRLDVVIREVGLSSWEVNS